MSFFKKRPVAAARTHTQKDLLDFGVETLESRRMLAGNIRILVNGAGDVTIRGDGKANHVEVSKESSGDILIKGLVDIHGEQTNIKGSANPTFVLPASNGEFSGKLNVILGGGHDFIVLRDITVNGDFNYRPGGGSDSLGFFQSTANGKSNLRTGGGNDYMNFVDANINGDLSAITGGGIDFVGMSNISLPSNRTASFITGGGGDIIYIEDSTVEGDLYAKTGGLIDTIYVAEGTTLNGAVDVDMGSLFDLLAMENNVNIDNADLNINGGRGGFGYQNLLFLYNTSPYYANPPQGIIGFEFNCLASTCYTISGTATTGFELSETLTKWVVDDYYGQSPSINFNVVDTLVAANMARGFDYADLPRSDGSAPDPAALAANIQAVLNSSDYYNYQKIFVRAAFQGEIDVFGWSDYVS